MYGSQYIELLVCCELSSLTWLKSAVITIKALGCCVCKPDTVVLMLQTAALASADGAMYAVITMVDINSIGK